MQRISTNMSNDDMQYHARMREYQLNNVQNRIASQNRLQELRDDPAAAAHATRYASYLNRLERYGDNIQYAQSRHRESEVYMQETVTVLQRVRELALQGANGSYSASDRRAMAAEVNQMLNQLVQTANSRGADGTMLFAGDRTQAEPFRAVKGRVEGFDELVVSQVQYLGTNARTETEIADGAYIPVNFAGNSVFWAENQQIFAATDATSYVVQADTSIRIDGQDIALREGDNVYAIMSKINQSGAPVRARLDPVTNALALQTTSPHQMWLEESGTVLQDLGVLSGDTSRPPANVATSARVFGGSMFDMMISLRDQLSAGDVLDIGGRGLGGIDTAMNNILGRLGTLGSFDERLQMAYQRTESDIPIITARYSNEVDTDMTEALTELKMLQFTHQAAIGAAARVIQSTLLDFLR